jgi:proteasome lid subunit RPN8/RPN11
VSPSTLFLPDAVRAMLVSHAADGAPEEVCGVLEGHRDGEAVRVTAAHAVANVAETPRTRYELDPAEAAAVFETGDDGTPETGDDGTPETGDAGPTEVGDAGAGDRADETADAGDARPTEVVGFYHSHPEGPDGPSATDRAQARWPDHVYVIVSLGAGGSGASDATPADAAVGAWLWTGETFARLTVRSS